jgi:hypothetical protein
VRHGAILPEKDPIRLATIVSFAGVGLDLDQIMEVLATAYDVAVQIIDTSVVRVHQHGASTCPEGSDVCLWRKAVDPPDNSYITGTG